MRNRSYLFLLPCSQLLFAVVYLTSSFPQTTGERPRICPETDSFDRVCISSLSISFAGLGVWCHRALAGLFLIPKANCAALAAPWQTHTHGASIYRQGRTDPPLPLPLCPLSPLTECSGSEPIDDQRLFLRESMAKNTTQRCNGTGEESKGTEEDG